MADSQTSEPESDLLLQTSPVIGAQAVAQCNGRTVANSFSTGVSRPAKPRHGVKRIVVFFLVIGVLAFALDRAINHGLRRLQTSKFGSLNRVMDGRVNADIIISGSSRALSHYDPRPIGRLTGYSAYNIDRKSKRLN